MAASSLETRIDMWIGLHTDAVPNERAQVEEEAASEYMHSQFVRDLQEVPLRGHRLAQRIVYRKSAEYLHEVYDRARRLKCAPEDRLQLFLELVRATDDDGDTQLHLLLCEEQKYKVEILGQLAGFVFAGDLKKLLNRTNNNGQSCLTVAILAGVDASLIRAMVVLGADYSNASSLVAKLNRTDLEGVFEATISNEEETQRNNISLLLNTSS